MQTDHLSPSMSHWLMQLVAMSLTVFLLPGLQVTGASGIVLTVGALSLLNTFLWSDILFAALPDSLTVQALLLVLANGAMFWALVKLLPGIEIHSFVSALAAPMVFSVLNVVTRHYAPLVDWSAVAAGTWDFTVDLFSAMRSFFEKKA